MLHTIPFFRPTFYCSFSLSCILLFSNLLPFVHALSSPPLRFRSPFILDFIFQVLPYHSPFFIPCSRFLCSYFTLSLFPRSLFFPAIPSFCLTCSSSFISHVSLFHVFLFSSFILPAAHSSLPLVSYLIPSLHCFVIFFSLVPSLAHFLCSLFLYLAFFFIFQSLFPLLFPPNFILNLRLLPLLFPLQAAFSVFYPSPALLSLRPFLSPSHSYPQSLLSRNVYPSIPALLSSLKSLLPP